MSLNLELQPDSEKRLREKAALLGVPLNAYIADLIERDVQTAEHPGYLNSPQERAAAWMA